MSGSAIEDDRDITLPVTGNSEQTVVLVGHTGNGKSATGNSILGRKVFKSRASSARVTSTCEKQKVVLKDGQVINVIDTPVLSGKEIDNCIELAKEGIHAVIVVFSLRDCFSLEELAALRVLQTLFGSKVVNYMIVVFTGIDDLEEDRTLEDYIGHECPNPLKEILDLCKNRYVLFDNRTKDERKKFEQVQQFLSLLNTVISQNGGKPYMVDELKEGAKRLMITKIESAFDAQRKRIAEVVKCLDSRCGYK